MSLITLGRQLGTKLSHYRSRLGRKGFPVLTFQTLRAKFHPSMRIYKQFLVILMVLALQSCYTMLYPPQTLPQTVTTVVSEPAMVSTIGGTGVYGWDPYWEPALPFTSYYTGYGASYYSPYNYYDYHHPHYAPVYVVSETSTPAPGRDFDRDEKQGGSRVREPNPPPASSNLGSKAGSTGLGSSMSTATAPIIQPASTKSPVIKSPVRGNTEVKPVSPPKKKVRSNTGNKQKPVKVTKSKSVKNTKESKKSDPPAPKKRTRTRK